MTYTESNLVATIEALAGQSLTTLSQEQLDGVDQFHAGGAEAVELLLPSLGITSDMTLLDVGSGFGGPARQIARATGCHVVGVDLTQTYVDAAEALTVAAGLDDRVSFVCADVAAVERRDFDAASTIHVQMNVADKVSFYNGIANRLRSGARLVVFEVCRRGDVEPAFPQPWSISGDDSFLDTPADLLAAIEAGGLAMLEWVDETGWVLAWFEGLVARWAAAGTAVTLPALLDDGPTRMMNFVDALAKGVLTIHRGTFIPAR